MRRAGRLERAFVLLVAAGAAAGAFAVSRTALEGIPHVADEIDYVFQAKTFASGRLTVPPPPVPEVFDHPGIVRTADRWCSKYHPGWPAVLALGMRLHLTPWTNPLMLALAVAGTWRLGRRLHDGRTGTVAAAALAASPFALLMSAGLMAHASALASSVWCLERLAAGAEDGGRGRFFAAGLLGGATFLIRPMTAVALLAPAAAWAWGRRARAGDGLASLACLALGAAPALAAFLAYDAAVWGSPWTTGYAVWDPTERFGGDRGTYVAPFTLFATNLPRYLRDLSRALWGWPWPDLLVLAPLAIPRPGRSRDAVLLACVAGLVGTHAFYYFYDVVYSGPRLAFEALAPLSILAARALLTLAEPLLASASGRVAAGAAAIGLAAFPLGVRLPAELRYHAQAYHGQTAAPLREAVRAGVGEDALVFVTSPEGPFAYGLYFALNDLDPAAGRRVYARALASWKDETIRRIPRPEVWRLRIDLDPLPGPNPYPDAWTVRSVEWKRLDVIKSPVTREDP